MSKEEIWQNLERDLKSAIPILSTRKMLLSSKMKDGQHKTARALLAKIYLYQENWSGALGMTSAIISSGDNSLSTPYDRMFTEAMNSEKNRYF